MSLTDGNIIKLKEDIDTTFIKKFDTILQKNNRRCNKEVQHIIENCSHIMKDKKCYILTPYKIVPCLYKSLDIDENDYNNIVLRIEPIDKEDNNIIMNLSTSIIVEQIFEDVELCIEYVLKLLEEDSALIVDKKRMKDSIVQIRHEQLINNEVKL